MGDLSRRGFGASVLAALSAGCLGNRAEQESETTPVPELTASQRTATAERVSTTSTPAADSAATSANSSTGQPGGASQTNNSTEPSARLQVETETPTPTPEPNHRSVDTTFRLEENEYEDFTVDVTGQTTLTYDLIVRRGPAVDIILFTEEEYRAFQSRHRARHAGEVSRFHTTNIRDNRVTIGRGTYRLVVNNTDWSRAVPSPSEPYDSLEGECLVDFSFSTEPAPSE
ncbi:hypothetical protein SAMN05443574_105159 [Haloarcula vallismortis]|uniref:Uncharacterized protein n=2 Tax=Haloarcula vallismortis TaxID=28442 RepID=M0JCM6_HALVA|nr:hypothetical protein [Haloarcula vallismortis]EMA06731.1 hypothetical protein C437_11523 [Haloarcula vallismortis ATCC 29715]SDW64006.1 hypothetical protein SAMN05443574_105159 [Haloarcula vallismortis]